MYGGRRYNVAIERFIQTGRTAATRLRKAVKLVDPDDEARSFPSSSQCDVPLEPPLATLTSPQRLSMAKVNRGAGRQLGTNCGAR